MSNTLLQAHGSVVWRPFHQHRGQRELRRPGRWGTGLAELIIPTQPFFYSIRRRRVQTLTGRRVHHIAGRRGYYAALATHCGFQSLPRRQRRHWALGGGIPPFSAFTFEYHGHLNTLSVNVTASDRVENLTVLNFRPDNFLCPRSRFYRTGPSLRGRSIMDSSANAFVKGPARPVRPDAPFHLRQRPPNDTLLPPQHSPGGSGPRHQPPGPAAQALNLRLGCAFRLGIMLASPGSSSLERLPRICSFAASDPPSPLLVWLAR